MAPACRLWHVPAKDLSTEMAVPGWSGPLQLTAWAVAAAPGGQARISSRAHIQVSLIFCLGHPVMLRALTRYLETRGLRDFSE